MSQQQQDDLVSNWALGVEVECDMTYNPITVKSADLCRQVNIVRYSVEYLHAPEAAASATLEERAASITKATMNGVRVNIDHSTLGPMQSTAWLPNFGMMDSPGLGLLESIALLNAACRYKRKMM